jgi:hypothetical protein
MRLRPLTVERIEPHRDIWDDLNDFDRRLWAPIENLCCTCARRKNRTLAELRLELLVFQRAAVAKLGPTGQQGMTGPHQCIGCGGYRSEGWGS